MDLNQKIFKYFVYYPVALLKYGNLPGYLRGFLKSQYLQKETLHEMQLMKLNNLIKYAKENVPYYRKNLLNTSKKDVLKLEDIRYLPFTTKLLTREYSKELISKESFRTLVKKTTGGSTGEPVTIWKTPDTVCQELAARWRAYSWAGVNIGDRQGRFWGVPSLQKDRHIAKLIDFVDNRKRCSAFSFDEKNLEKYTEILFKFNPAYFYGYVSMLAEYAEYIKREEKKNVFDLKCIISTSEVLTPYHRRLLEETFNTKVFNEYGSGELGSVAHECENGSMHVMSENMIVEVLDGERLCEPGETGELVVTELNNMAMPLIRYRTGDFASLSEKKCPCGKTLPIIENIAGRAYDMLRNKHGRLFHGEFFMYIFEEAKRKKLGIGAFQVIQLKPDMIKIKVKPERGYGENTEKLIETRIRDGFDSDVKLNFEKVESIPREASGKMRLIVGMN